MSIDRGSMMERLPFLLELADELGLPHRVVPWMARTGAGDVVSATVRLQVHAGAEDPHEDGDGHGWVEVTNSHDLRAAADRRSRAPIDVLPVGTSTSTPAPVEPGVYRGRRAVPAARILLQLDLNEPEIRGAVEIRQVEERRGTDPRDSLWVDELVVDWPRVLDPALRSTDAILLAQIARSLLDGHQVDLRRTASLSGHHAARLAEAMTLVADRALGG